MSNITKRSTSILVGEDIKHLYDVPLPKATNTYCPVSHKDIVESIMNEVDKHNLIVKDHTCHVNSGGNKAMGKMTIKSEDEELGMMLAWRNSYDKSMSLGFAAGGNVFICGNGMIVGNLRLVRKHTWGIKREIETVINQTRSYMEYQFNDLIQDKNWMKEIDRPNFEKTSEIVGKMYLMENILTANQLGVVKRELEQVYDPSKTEEAVDSGLKSGHFYGDTMWDFYNNITEGLKGSASDKYIESHINAHQYFKRELV